VKALPPTSWLLTTTPGIITPRFTTDLLPVGIASMMSRVTTRCVTTFCTSTVGVSPVTVIVSSSEPTRRSTLMFAVNDAVSSTPSRRTVLKPCSANVTVYDPGTRLMILYWPAASVTAVRTFSISDGLAASTVTPGSTAPVASFTTPAILLLL
jgi:hypothetical protein